MPTKDKTATFFSNCLQMLKGPAQQASDNAKLLLLLLPDPQNASLFIKLSVLNKLQSKQSVAAVSSGSLLLHPVAQLMASISSERTFSQLPCWFCYCFIVC